MGLGACIPAVGSEVDLALVGPYVSQKSMELFFFDAYPVRVDQDEECHLEGSLYTSGRQKWKPSGWSHPRSQCGFVRAQPRECPAKGASTPVASGHTQTAVGQNDTTVPGPSQRQERSQPS